MARAANEAGKPASVCGDVSADPATAVLLLGMGYDSVSIAPQFLPELKYAIRRSTLAESRADVEEVVRQETVDGVRTVLERIRTRVYSESRTG